MLEKRPTSYRDSEPRAPEIPREKNRKIPLQSWEATDLGNCPVREKSPKVVRRGCNRSFASGKPKFSDSLIEVSEMASAKKGVRNRVHIDDVGSILKFRIGFAFGENSAGFCRSVWLLGSILNFRIGSVSSIGGLIAGPLFANAVSGSQTVVREGVVAEIMPQHIRVPKLLSCYFDCCLALHVFLPQSVVD